MGKITGFKEYERVNEEYEAVKERLNNYKEFTIPLSGNARQCPEFGNGIS